MPCNKRSPHPTRRPPPPCRAQAALFVQEQRSRKPTEWAGGKCRVDFEGVVVTVGAAAVRAPGCWEAHGALRLKGNACRAGRLRGLPTGTLQH